MTNDDPTEAIRASRLVFPSVAQFAPPPLETSAAVPSQITLDPNDPVESVLISMVLTNRAKRKDYALDGDVFSNFREVAENLGIEGFEATESCFVLLLTKVARLKALRANGRMSQTQNESVQDTILDLAVYASILLALYTERANVAVRELPVF